MDDNDDHQLRLQGLRRMLERKRIIRQNILGATGDVVDNLGDRDDDEGNFDSMHYLEYYQSLGRDPPPGFNWENQAMTPVLDAEELDLDEYQILVYHHDRYLATGIRNVNRDQTDEADEWRIMQESKGRALGHYHNWQGGHDVEMEVLENDNGDVDFGNDEAGEVLEEEEVVEEEELVEEEVVMETAGGVLTHNYGVGGESPADIQIALSVSDAAKTDTDPLVESLVSNTAAALTPHPNTPAERDLSAKSPVDKEPEPVARQLFAKVVSIGKVTGDIATLDIGASTEADIDASTEADMSNYQCDCFDNRPNCQAKYEAPFSPWEIAKNAGLEVKLEGTCPTIAKIFDTFNGLWMFCGNADGGLDVVSQFRAKLTQESLSGEKPDYSDSSLYLDMNEPDKVPSNYLVLGIPAGGYREVKTQLFERASVNEALEIRSAYAELFYRDKEELGYGKTTWKDVSKSALTDIIDAGILPVYVEKMQDSIYKYKVITTNDETREEKAAMKIFVDWIQRWKEYANSKLARDARNPETTKSFFTNVLNTKATNTIGYASNEVWEKVLDWANNGGNWKSIFPDCTPLSQDTTAVDTSTTQGCDEHDATCSRSDDSSESNEEDKTVTVELLGSLDDFKTDKEFVAKIIKIVGDSSEEDKSKRKGLTTMKQVPGNSERRDRNLHQPIAFLAVKYAVLLQFFDSLEQIFSDDPAICSIETLVDVVLFFTNIPKKFWYSKSWDVELGKKEMSMMQLLGMITVNILTILQIQCVNCHRCVVDSPDLYHISGSFHNDHWLKFFDKEFDYSRVRSNKFTLWKEFKIKGFVRTGLFELLKAIGIKCGFDHYRMKNEPDDWDERCLQQPTTRSTRRLAEKSFPGTRGLTFGEIFSHYEVAALILMWDDLGAFTQRKVCKFTLTDLNIPVSTLIGISVFDLTYLRTDDQLRNLTPNKRRREVTNMIDVLCAKISGNCFSPDCNECFLHLSPSSKVGVDWHHVLGWLKTANMSDLRSNGTIQEWYREGILGGCRQGCKGCHARVTAVTNGYLELNWCDESGAILEDI